MFFKELTCKDSLFVRWACDCPSKCKLLRLGWTMSAHRPPSRKLLLVESKQRGMGVIHEQRFQITKIPSYFIMSPAVSKLEKALVQF